MTAPHGAGAPRESRTYREEAPQMWLVNLTFVWSVAQSVLSVILLISALLCANGGNYARGSYDLLLSAFCYYNGHLASVQLRRWADASKAVTP